MIDENRRRLTALVAAGTKLDAAARLVKEATIDIASSGLLPDEYVENIATDIDACIRRINTALDEIPST